jgi:hypothetical protein
MEKMKGVEIAALVWAFLTCFNLALAMEPIETPLQYSQLCEAQKISGHGAGEVSISLLDYQLGLDYSSSLAGNGDFDIDQVHAYSQRAELLQRRIESINQTHNLSLNLFQNIKLTYLGTSPLVGANSLASAIGGIVAEKFAVNRMNRDQTTFVASTKDSNNSITIQASNPVHLMGINTKNSFDGIWGTDSTWHEMLSKDVKSHEMFKGTFDIEKLIKFHESPVPEKEESTCEGVDC